MRKGDGRSLRRNILFDVFSDSRKKNFMLKSFTIKEALLVKFFFESRECWLSFFQIGLKWIRLWNYRLKVSPSWRLWKWLLLLFLYASGSLWDYRQYLLVKNFLKRLSFDMSHRVVLSALVVKYWTQFPNNFLIFFNKLLDYPEL